MAAFIQKLFKKRTPAATRPDTRTPRSPGAHRRPDPAETRAEPEGPEQQRPEQSLIDQQRKSLASADVSQNTLADLALQGIAADIRLEAVRRLSDEALLHQVQKGARGRDKGVYQHARQALQESRAREERTQQTREAISKLRQRARELTTTGDTTLFEARVQQLEQQWHDMEPDANNDERTAVLAVLHECRARARELAEAQAETRRHQDQKTQRDQTLELLGQTIADLEQQASTPAALPSLDALQRTQENRWLEATRDTDVSRPEQKQYEQLMQILKAYTAAIRRLDQYQDEILSHSQPLPNAGDEAASQARALLNTLDWPTALPQPDSLQQLAKIAHVKPSPARDEPAEEDQGEQLAAIDRTIERLEQTLADNLLKESRQQLKQAQGQLRKVSGKEVGRYQQRIKRLAGQVHELGDWQGFATGPKQMALCEQMEYLAEQPMDPEAKATLIQELQQEWRDLGGSSDRELWQRFRSAAEKAFEPCKAYFEARSDLKQVHLQKRRTICQELQQYLDGNDWNAVDWKAVEQIEKAARKEWREAWPVNFRDNRPLQKQFDRLITSLTDKLDAERKHNEALKLTIVERAQALAEHEPLDEAMSQAKALQAQWQDIGITRHREDRKLWQAFRAACDRIFGRRDEERQHRQQQTSQADLAASTMLDKAAALLQADTLHEVEARTALEKVDQTSATPISAEYRRRLQETATRLRQHLQEQARAENAKQWQTWIRARAQGELTGGQLPEPWHDLQERIIVSSPRELVVLAEILSGNPSPEEDQTLRMELQVRRLKEGLEGTTVASGNDPAKSLETFTAHWCLGFTGAAMDKALAERLCNVISPD